MKRENLRFTPQRVDAAIRRAYNEVAFAMLYARDLGLKDMSFKMILYPRKCKKDTVDYFKVFRIVLREQSHARKGHNADLLEVKIKSSVTVHPSGMSYPD